MVENVRLRVLNYNVRVFGGKIALPRGDYYGGISSYVFNHDGKTQTVPADALIKVDRHILESLGENIVPNLPSVDFGILEHILTGDIQVLRL
jgi:hypothetical protein